MNSKPLSKSFSALRSSVEFKTPEISSFYITEPTLNDWR